MSITESYDETVALNDVSPADMDRQRRYSKMTTIGGAGDTGPAGHFWTVRLAQAWKYPRMTNARALARVHRDLAAGHPRAAARRLRTMLARDPNNIEIYRLLASIHRLLGDPAEAGRWGFLTDDVTEAEIAAFQRAHPQAWIRLRLLGWSGDPAKLPSDACRARLAVLSREVAECTIPTQREAKRTNPLHGQAGTLGRPVVPGTIPTQRGASQPTTGGLLIPHGPFPGAGRAGTPGGFQAGTDETGRAAQRRFEPGSVSWNDRAVDRRPERSPFRTYAMLILLILGGSVGSVIAVGGIRAVFGVEDWDAPITALLSAIARLFTS